MQKTKKWMAIALVSSQLLTSLPVSATILSVEDSSIPDTSETAEEQPTQPEGNEALPEGNEQEVEEQPVEEQPTIPDEPPKEPEPPKDTPKETPEEQPELVPETERPKEEPVKEEPIIKEDTPATPNPDVQVNPVNQTNEMPSVPQTMEEVRVPGLTEQTPSESSESSSFKVTPVKETWDFIQEIGEEAREIGLKEDLYASVMIAQAILESGSGQSQLSQDPYFNLYGIKGSYNGNSVTFKTQEDDGSGTLYSINSAFRQYENYEESLKDYARLMKDGLTHAQDFYKGSWKSETETYEDATAYLTGRYATDTQYADKLNALIEAYALTSYDQARAELPEGSEEFIYPVQHAVVSSPFGPRGGEFHRGVDFAAPVGTPIFASQAGVVIRSEVHSSWGNYIAITHENGLTTLYAHNNQNLVTVGQTVAQGEIIASVGSTGNSTGPHLHFEVNGSPSLAQDQLIDPMQVLTKE